MWNVRHTHTHTYIHTLTHTFILHEQFVKKLFQQNKYTLKNIQNK